MKHGLRAAFFGLCALMVLQSCYSPQSGGIWTWNGKSISSLWLTSLAERLGESWQTVNVDDYLQYYGFPRGDIRVDVARVNSGIDKVFTIRFTPRQIRTRAVIVHGYMGNSGHYADLAATLLAKGTEVILMDLPGHGLSTGPRNNIDSFRQYGDALSRVIAFACGTDETVPLAGFGHSTGGSTWLDFLARYPDQAAQVDSIVFACPLIRPSAWALKNGAVGLLVRGPVDIPRIPLISSGSIGNPEFRDFQIYGDPLYVSIFDPGWIRALETWTREVETWTGLGWKGPLFIVQGANDDVVEWQWNTARIKELLPQTEVKVYAGLSHNILQETPDLRAAPLADTVEVMGRF